MVKFYTIEQLEAKALEIFIESHPRLNRLLATHDGQFFAESARNDAANYARETKQELVVIEKIHDLTPASASPDDPLTRDVTALMLALNISEEEARRVIEHYQGNAPLAATEQRAIQAAVELNTETAAPADGSVNTLTEPAPAAKPRRTRKPKPTDGTS